MEKFPNPEEPNDPRIVEVEVKEGDLEVEYETFVERDKVVMQIKITPAIEDKTRFDIGLRPDGSTVVIRILDKDDRTKNIAYAEIKVPVPVVIDQSEAIINGDEIEVVLPRK